MRRFFRADSVRSRTEDSVDLPATLLNLYAMPSLKKAERRRIYYSTEQFSAGVLWSLEGQWQFRVGKELAVAVQLEPDELFRWPKNNEIVQITGKSICEDPAGCFNYNNLAQTFAAICGHVICTNTDHLCANPIRPHGHCCPICGGVINLHENGINFSWLKEKIMRLQTVTGFRTSNFQMGLTLQRIDRDTPMPSYQIAVIPLSPRGGHADVYDEDLIEQFIEEVIADITIIDCRPILTSRINHGPKSHRDNWPKERTPPLCGTTASRTMRKRYKR
uniref:Protein amnionless n=1 Tax=Plectus sambesii TaxID=2011161 RepID=A0A914WCW2_9BILA